MNYLEPIYKAIAKDRSDLQAYRDAFAVIRETGGVKEAHELQRMLPLAPQVDAIYDINRKILCFCAPECFDDFLLYMEIDRPFERQFYLPRRKQLKPLVDDLQRLENRELTLLAISMPPGTGKTGLEILFSTFTGGRHPEKPILIGSHSKDFLTGVYGEIDRILDPNGEYKFYDIFPNLSVINQNAKTLMMDLGRDQRDTKRYMTFEMTSIGSGNAGKVRAGNLLICDDLVDSLETAMSKDRLDKLYDAYATDLRQRKIGNCAELHIATRWSLYDVIGRLEEKYGKSRKAKFITVPALNDDDESNFDYPIENGFTTEFYHEQRSVMEDTLWQALYMNKPIEREGQLFREETLRRYFTLPDRQPDAVIAVCDTKDRGPDDAVLPVAFVYGEDYYIEDAVVDDGPPKVVDVRLAMCLVKNRVQLAQFECNAAGGKTAEKVQEMVKEMNGITHITTMWSEQNKETKILVNSPWVMEHCLFKDNSVIKEDKEYRKMIRKLCSYSLKAKNTHDDVPDAFSQLAQFAQNLKGNKTTVIRSPFRG